jgi:hypothetical protein
MRWVILAGTGLVTLGILAAGFYSKWDYLVTKGSCRDHLLFGWVLATFCSGWSR